MLNKILYWTPRILGIVLILFISIFSFDALEEGFFVFFMNFIPSLLLVTALLVAWKNEFVGGIIYILLATVYSVLTIVGDRPLEGILIIGGSVFLVGVLFIVHSITEVIDGLCN